MEPGVDLPIEYIALGGVRTEWFSSIGSSMRLSQHHNKYWKTPLPVTVGNQDAGNSDPMILFKSGNSYLYKTAYHCNWEGDDCWYVRTQPSITSISDHYGSELGGQLLVLRGHNLRGSTVEVTVDGVPCPIFKSWKNRRNNDSKITCRTGPKSIATNPSK